MRLPTPLLVVVTLLVGSCAGDAPAPVPRTEPTRSVRPSVDPPDPTPGPSATPTPSAGPFPAGVPTTYRPDAAAEDVPPEALIPPGAVPTGEWFAFTDSGVTILIAWAELGKDPTRLSRGLGVWRPAASAPHWRLAAVRTHRANEGLMEIQVTAADVTGEGSDDAIVLEGTSGSGACGTWLVLELRSLERIFERDLCDARVEPAPEPHPGLVVTEAVFREGDAHCCPSAIRRTTLEWTGSRWRVSDRIETAA
jgi:hypothetical protein